MKKSLNYFENEFLVLGGTNVRNVSLLNSTYRVGWRTYAAYSLENAAFVSGGFTITIGVGAGIYHGGTAAYNYVNGSRQ